jgi:hypothetical protein
MPARTTATPHYPCLLQMAALDHPVHPPCQPSRELFAAPRPVRHATLRPFIRPVTFSIDPTLPTDISCDGTCSTRLLSVIPTQRYQHPWKTRTRRCLAVPCTLTLTPLFLQTGAPHHAAPLGAIHVHPATPARPGRHGRRAAACDTGAPAPHRKGMFGPIYSVF